MKLIIAFTAGAVAIIILLSWLILQSSQRRQKLDEIRNSARAIPFSYERFAADLNDDNSHMIDGIQIVSGRCSGGYLSIVIAARTTAGGWSEPDYKNFVTYIESVPSSYFELIDKNGETRRVTSVREFVMRSAKDGEMINFGSKHALKIHRVDKNITYYFDINMVAGDCDSVEFIRIRPPCDRPEVDLFASEMTRIDHTWYVFTRGVKVN